MSIGFIYKVTNTLNGKIYVGQTSNTVERRWNAHIRDSFKTKENYTHFQKAIRKYGKDSFTVETLEACSVDKLNERECFWISFYDSYHNGYNSTLGGEGFRSLELDEEQIIYLYNQNKSLSQIADIYDVSPHSIKMILKKCGYEIRDVKESLRLQGTSLSVKFEDGTLYNFNSFKEAGEFVLSAGLSKCRNNKIAASGIRSAILTGKKLYGGVWSSEEYSEEYLNEQRLRTKSYSRNYKYKNNPTHYKKDFCPNCGKLKDKGAKLCHVCHQIKKLNGHEKPDKSKLKELLQSKSENDIAIMYGITVSSVRRWINDYNIPRTSNHAFKISDKEKFLSLAKNHSISELEQIYGVSHKVIIRWKRESGLPIRSESKIQVY